MRIFDYRNFILFAQLVVVMALMQFPLALSEEGTHEIYDIHFLPQRKTWKTQIDYRYKSLHEKRNIPNADSSLSGRTQKYTTTSTILEGFLSYGAKTDFEIGIKQNISLDSSKQLDMDSEGNSEDIRKKSGPYNPEFFARNRLMSVDWGEGIFDFILRYSPNLISAKTDSSDTGAQVTNVARGGSFFGGILEAGRKNDFFAVSFGVGYGQLSDQKVEDMATGDIDIYKSREVFEVYLLTQTKITEGHFLTFNFMYKNIGSSFIRFEQTDYFEQSQALFDTQLGTKWTFFNNSLSAKFLFGYHYEPIHDLSVDGETALSITERQGFDLIAGVDIKI